jgi:hypothetical protein
VPQVQPVAAAFWPATDSELGGQLLQPVPDATPSPYAFVPQLQLWSPQLLSEAQLADAVLVQVAAGVAAASSVAFVAVAQVLAPLQALMNEHVSDSTDRAGPTAQETCIVPKKLEFQREQS